MPPGAPTFAESRSFGDYDIGGALQLHHESHCVPEPELRRPFEGRSVRHQQLDPAGTGGRLHRRLVGVARHRPVPHDAQQLQLRDRARAPARNRRARPVPQRASRCSSGCGKRRPRTPSGTGLHLRQRRPDGSRSRTFRPRRADNHTIPFFATGNYPVRRTTCPNNQTITIKQGDAQWALLRLFSEPVRRRLRA